MQENPKDGDKISSWYQDRLRRFGEGDHRSLGFNQRSSQLLRFEAISQLGDFSGRRILDAGCGHGDFLNYLLERGVVPDYTGLDLVPEMIEHCKARFRNRMGPLCQFEMGDILNYEPSKKFDYVVASGMFGLFTENARERIAPTIQRLFSWCQVGLAVNFLSRRAAKYSPECLYVDPGQMLGAALELTPAVRLSHNYLPNDFTIYLYRTAAWERNNGDQTPDEAISFNPRAPQALGLPSAVGA